MVLVNMQMCKSLEGPRTTNVGGYTQHNMFSERDWPTCTCPAYKYSKATIQFGTRKVKPKCKHILKTQEDACGWHEQWSGERQTEKGTCPRCGGPTVGVTCYV